MKIIRTQQRYRCGFCKRTGVKSAIERHEKICFRNPNRHCDLCDNKGYILEEVLEGYPPEKGDCPFCSSFNKKMLEEIEARESADKEVKRL
jgi:hypothetical protein